MNAGSGQIPSDETGTREHLGEPTIELTPGPQSPSGTELTLEVTPGTGPPGRQAAEAPLSGQFIGRFELRERLGEGGFGFVFRAYDPVLERDVALKVPRFLSRNPREVEFFLREAKAAARLRHPNIVAVFESGCADGSYYIATEFVEGQTLLDHMAEGRLLIRSAVQWVRELAEATAYAHSEGIVHRDIKPANIMIGKSGRPQLMDFGLAKWQRGQDEVSIDGTVIGTPSYMSPEQARGDVHHTGAPSDQYSLGAVLYQALTGQKPYSGPAHSVVMQVADVRVSPPPPSAIDSTIPKDLEACCLKAMEKEPERRYSDALEFAADLRRWLAGGPVHARPISSAERLWRWCDRNRVVAGMATAIVLLLIAGSLTATVTAMRFRNLAERERLAAKRTEAALADMYVNSGLVASEAGDTTQAVLWFANAAWQAGGDELRRDANLIRVRNWCSRTPWPIAVLPHEGRLKQVLFHPAGRYLSTLAYSQQCVVWEWETGELIELPGFGEASAVAWSPDGKWLAVGGRDRVVLWSFPDGKQRRELPHAGTILALAFSSDGRNLAIGSESVHVWNMERQSASPPLHHPQPVAKLLFNKKGDRLLTACQDSLVRVFAVDENGPRSEPLFAPLANLGTYADPEEPLQPLWIDGDRGLLTLSAVDQLTWWDSETGRSVRQVSAESAVLSVAKSADEKRFVVCGPKTAELWDVKSRTAIGDALAHGNFVYSAAFSNDSQTVVTASADRKVGMWSADTGKPRGQMLSHQGEVELVVYAPDGLHFVAAQRDGLVRIWELPTKDSSLVRRVEITAAESFVTLGADGRTMTPSGWNFQRGLGTVQTFNIETGTPEKSAVTPSGAVNNVALSPDGNRLVTVCSLPANSERAPEAALLTQEPGRVEFWNRKSGARIFDPLQTPSEPLGVAWSSDGKFVAVICGGGQILIIDAETGQTRRHCDHGASIEPRYMVRSWIRFAPDGQSFVTWGMGSLVKVWEASSGRLKYEQQYTGMCFDAQYSRDGNLLATMTMDGTANILKARTGEVLARLWHPDWVFTGAFSRDGRLLLTASRDRMARIWNWQQEKLVCPAMEHEDEIFGVAFAAEERAIVTCGRDNTARIWESFTGKPLAQPIKLPGAVYMVAVTPDEEYAVFAGRMNALYVVRLRDVLQPVTREVDLDQTRAFSEIISGQRVHERGGIVNLTSQEWLQRWKSTSARHVRFSGFR